MMTAAIKNLGRDNTKGCVDCNPILVATDADDQNIENNMPVVMML